MRNLAKRNCVALLQVTIRLDAQNIGIYKVYLQVYLVQRLESVLPLYLKIIKKQSVFY